MRKSTLKVTSRLLFLSLRRSRLPFIQDRLEIPFKFWTYRENPAQKLRLAWIWCCATRNVPHLDQLHRNAACVNNFVRHICSPFSQICIQINYIHLSYVYIIPKFFTKIKCHGSVTKRFFPHTAFETFFESFLTIF